MVDGHTHDGVPSAHDAPRRAGDGQTAVPNALVCFVLLAKFLGVPADPDQIAHQRGRGEAPYHLDDLARVAKQLGLIARRRKVEIRDLAKLPLPALITAQGAVTNRQDDIVILLKVEDDATSPRYLVQRGDAVRRAVLPQSPAARSLSALVWLAHSGSAGFDLAHHNVFFSADYPSEFRDLGSGAAPQDPTAYVCALDRGHGSPPGGRERLQIIVNAPANGDSHRLSSEEKAQCTSAMLARLRACGLELEQPLPHRLQTPADFAARFPGTGGALYGRASHGWAASFLRPGSRTAIRGLYCAGGATHPGAGVPMAALSAIQASDALQADHGSTRLFHHRATAGGMSTPSAMTAATG